MLLSLLVACGTDVSVGPAKIDHDGDGYSSEVDCDDAHATVNPDAPEVCDGVDQDCDGAIDEEATDASTWYADADGDAFGDASTSTESCAAPAGYLADATDCDDTLSSISPDAPEVCDGVDQDCDGAIDEEATDASTWYADADGDAFGDPSTSTEACASPAGHLADATDCDDTLSSINPDAPEVCDGVDQDCDGAIDEEATDASTWYADADGDAFGDPSTATSACASPAGHLADATDCDDGDRGVHPGAEEICDGIDQDCDGTADNGAIDAPLWYADDDGDGYAGDDAVQRCEAPADHFPSPTDCDDGSAAVNPGATELCDTANVDEDCDGPADDEDSAAAGKTRWYRDADADTFGSATASTTACDLPPGYVATATDCNDGDATVNPGALEVCDVADTDEDCDALADDADPSVTGTTAWFTDGDGDGYAGPASVSACTAPGGSAASTTDCDDGDATVSPAGAEVCDDGVDQDCDGLDEACGGLRGSMDIDVGYTTKIYGEAASDYFGMEILSGDFDGDGAGDLVVAALGHRYAGEPGTLFAYYGPFAAGASAATTHDDLLLYSTSHHPEATLGTQFGDTMGNLGDIDGDGRDDLWALRVYEPGMVFYGGDTGVAADVSNNDASVTCSNADAAGDVYPATATPEWVCGDAGYGSGAGRAFLYTDPATQVAEITAEAGGDRAGMGYAGPGDVDGDGFDDLWVGAPSNTGYQGAAYLLLGPISGTVALASADEKILGTDTYEGLGWHISAGDDVDGDGYNDAFLGAPWVCTVGDFNGAVYLVTDPRSGQISSVAAAKMTGVAEQDVIGGDKFDVGDIDGDGVPDLLAASSHSDEGATDGGALWLVYGPMAGTFSLADADAQWVSSEAGALMGLYNVAAVPDTDGDGADEVAVGARAADTSAYTDNGAVWVWMGEP